MAYVRPPLRDRILLYLMGFTGFENEIEVPVGLTQKGMAEALGSKRAVVTQVLGELKDKDFVIERVCHVKGSPRRLKTYLLTPDGRTMATRVWNLIIRRKVSYTYEDGETRELMIRDVLDLYNRRLDVSTLLKVVNDYGFCGHEGIVRAINKRAERVKAEQDLGPQIPQTIEAPKVEGMTTEAMQERGPPSAAWQQYYYYYQQPYSTQQQQPPSYPYGAYSRHQWHAAQPPPRIARPQFVIGMSLIIASILMIFNEEYLNEFMELACIINLILVIVGILLVVQYYGTLRRSRLQAMPGLDRYLILVISMVMGYILAAAMSITFGTEWTDDETSLVVSIHVALLFVLFAKFLMRADVRGQIGLIAGTFLLAMAFGGLVSPDTFPWLTVHPVMWMATGTMAFIVGNEISKPNHKETGLAVSAGIGLYIMFVSMVLMHGVLTSRPGEEIFGANRSVLGAAFALWFCLGVVIAGVRYAPISRLEAIYDAMGITSVVCISVAFMMFGAWFIRLERVEGIIDFMLGLAIIYYAFQKLMDKKKSHKRTIYTVMGYSVFIEVLTLGLALKLF